MSIKYSKKNTGFTLLFASLIVSLLLSVGIAILNITLQQVLLSSAAKESQFAFYNSDTGIECALYWDKNSQGFATSSTYATNLNQSSLTCNLVHPVSYITQLSTRTNAAPGSYDTIFDLVYDSPECVAANNPNTPIVNVIVNKSISGSDVFTDVLSRGYNTCDAANPRRVERGLEVQY